MVQMKKEKKLNPNCPVFGCRAKLPHRQERHVDALMRLVELPQLMCGYVMDGLAHLGNSACNDLANHNALGFLTRQRQIQELYLRTLYLLLLADTAEQIHMVSGAMPNGLSGYYRKVNEVIYHNQTDWEGTTPGLNGDTFTIMETLHDGAHVSFKSLVMARGYYDQELAMDPERFADYIKKLISKLAYMHGMFKDGRPREHVLDGMQAMHQPSEYWEKQQRAARENASEQQLITEPSQHPSSVPLSSPTKIEVRINMDIEIKDFDPKNPDAGLLTSQVVVPHTGIAVTRDDLLRNPDEASEKTMDDLHKKLLP
jgi:hypothetical protein